MRLFPSGSPVGARRVSHPVTPYRDRHPSDNIKLDELLPHYHPDMLPDYGKFPRPFVSGRALELS